LPDTHEEKTKFFFISSEQSPKRYTDETAQTLIDTGFEPYLLRKLSLLYHKSDKMGIANIDKRSGKRPLQRQRKTEPMAMDCLLQSVPPVLFVQTVP